jgi:starch phosphorylase
MILTMEVRRFTVSPRLPDKLARLSDLAHNLWWCWNPDAIFLFRRINENLFAALNHNPVKLLGVESQVRLNELASDDGFIAHLDRVWDAFNDYLKSKTWFHREGRDAPKDMKIAYFSAEFGLHESFPIYSGGLGILAGDHVKSASDLGLPLVAVGLMYQQGYFRQYLNADGWQQERYPENDFYNMTCKLERSADGKPVVIGVEFPGRNVFAQIWRADVGRTPLYLLDCNITQNNGDDRKITAQLYGGDQDMRVKQELILGVGGLRALSAIGIEPTVCHMNEGHSAFLALERVASTMEQRKVDFATARQIVAAGNVFTTHTPVEAGNDMFPPYLVEGYLEPFVRRLGIDKGELLGLGRQRPGDQHEPFCMTVLAIRLANHCNGVSALHGKVSRHMWRNIWPDLPEDDVPITSITNGIHTLSMLSGEMRALYDRYLGPDWVDRLDDERMWAKVESIPDAELWRIHERRRLRLVAFVRSRVKRQLASRGLPATDVAAAEEILDPDALTIGFARRFATYKRGTLLFRDPERLAHLLNDPKRPIQIVFAGKAHPKDQGGKELIAQIAHVARRPEFARRIVFIEDYDINVGRHMVHGVDVWLNNPRRPLEASGTSGMKAPINGGLNLSVLDGWWCEAYGAERENGWAIGAGEEYSDLNYHDDVESRAIYELLEKEVTPLFYDRGVDNLPRGWIRWMKRSMETVAPVFNTSRMVAEYYRRAYHPAATRYRDLTADSSARGRELSLWLKDVQSKWDEVRVEGTEAASSDGLAVGRELTVRAAVKLASLTPKDVTVELYHGAVDASGNIIHPSSAPMTADGAVGGGVFRYEGKIPCRSSGQHGYAIRVRPNHVNMPRSFEPGLYRWG